jgi:DNA-binding CsgD family transcriptional regulator
MDPAREFLQAVLESAEVGVVVIDSAMRPLYINASARQLLDSPDGQVPDWLASALPPLQAQLARSAQAVDRVSNGDLTLRVRLRALEPGVAMVELQVAQGGGARHVTEHLARGLGLTGPDAALLALLWRGLSNEEIAQALQVRTGTIKSRLFRLYQKLGVKKRPAAVLRAAEVLGHQPVAAAA